MPIPSQERVDVAKNGDVSSELNIVLSEQKDSDNSFYTFDLDENNEATDYREKDGKLIDYNQNSPYFDETYDSDENVIFTSSQKKYKTEISNNASQVIEQEEEEETEEAEADKEIWEFKPDKEKCILKRDLSSLSSFEPRKRINKEKENPAIIDTQNYDTDSEDELLRDFDC